MSEGAITFKIFFPRSLVDDALADGRIGPDLFWCVKCGKQAEGMDDIEITRDRECYRHARCGGVLRLGAPPGVSVNGAATEG